MCVYMIFVSPYLQGKLRSSVSSIIRLELQFLRPYRYRIINSQPRFEELKFRVGVTNSKLCATNGRKQQVKGVTTLNIIMDGVSHQPS